MPILSIQSRVAYGHVGNAAAVFPLQRLGFEVWALDTVSFSNHLGYPTWRGRTHPAGELAELVDGLDQLGVFGQCEALLSGYLGDPGNAEVVLDLLGRVRAANPGALYLCDPVMGDRHCGFYVGPELPPVFAGRLLPAADIALPNAFELEQLTGGSTATLPDALAAVDALRRSGPATVVATSIDRRDGPVDDIEVLAVDGGGAWLARTPRQAIAVHGTGDTFAALFLGHYLRTRRLDTALARAVTAIDAVIAATVAAGSDELMIVAAQDALPATGPTVPVERIR